MTTEEKAKAYDEAIKKAKEIKEKIVYSHLSTESCKAVSEYIDTIIPELRESEDERIRRTLAEYFGPEVQLDLVRGVPIQKIRDWLEKQKINTEGDFGRGYDCGYQAGYAVAMNEMKPKVATATLDSEKQKEQEHICDSAQYEEGFKTGLEIGLRKQKEQKPAEWSEEDEAMIKSILFVLESYVSKAEREQNPALTVTYPTYYKEIAWLKSLRPQPREEIYHAAKHDLAIRFMNYLDENRPEGKMGLSNGECEDIDKAFKENDWAKIMRYVEKYSPSWKPSEDEERLINTSISFLKDFADKGYENAVECIDWLKSKLNGNSGK